MKKPATILSLVLLLAAAILVYLNFGDSWSQSEKLEGYDPEQEQAEYEANKPDDPIQAAPVSGVNPPHGQPGHRCDLPVGASLDQPVNPQLDGSILNATTRVNPPHGQPGHRCDLPVGAALP
ncbi:hypothetical protein [Robertkochia aurantiaca]|uniref:hypothetical protein n=1 Tax=Robertkochia aurantiaca TaxID=2873700 RepID=UPI001CC9CAA0|nr:hypothetical protein [Robertkochia sp. 3YJGBD-33]